MSNPEKVTNADRVYVYRDNHHYLCVSEVKPGKHIPSLEFVRVHNHGVPTNEIGNARMGGE